MPACLRCLRAEAFDAYALLLFRFSADIAVVVTMLLLRSRAERYAATICLAR